MNICRSSFSTHIYCFSVGMPPETIRHILRIAIDSPVTKVLMMYGGKSSWGDVRNTRKFRMSMKGSQEKHTCTVIPMTTINREIIGRYIGGAAVVPSLGGGKNIESETLVFEKLVKEVSEMSDSGYSLFVDSWKQDNNLLTTVRSLRSANK